MCEAPVTHQKPCGEAGFVSYTFWPFKAYRRPARSAVTGAVLEMSPWPTSAERAQTGDGLQIASSGTYAFIQRADVTMVNLFCREAMHACYLTQEIMGNLHPASASYQSSLTKKSFSNHQKQCNVQMLLSNLVRLSTRRKPKARQHASG